MSEKLWEAYWDNERNHEWWERPAKEVLDLIRSESPENGPEALDLGCGLGRHALALAVAGFHVTATDRSHTAVAYLDEWSNRLGLDINAKACDILDDDFPPESFDLVISYNVIYHGSWGKFAEAIEHVAHILKPGGRFFFTAPTRHDGKYGHGEEVAPHTFACERSVTPGDIHYFPSEGDLDELLAGFRLISRSVDEGYWDNKGVRQFYSNWLVLAEKL